MQPEQAIKADIREYLTNNTIYWDNVAQGQFSKPGQPDIIQCVDGRFVQIEVKTAAGQLRPIQAVRGVEIRDSGGKYIVVRSVDDLDKQLNDMRFGTVSVI